MLQVDINLQYTVSTSIYASIILIIVTVFSWLIHKLNIKVQKNKVIEGIPNKARLGLELCME